MSQRARILTLGAIAFLLWAVIATATAIYYYREYASADQRYNEYYQKYLSAQQNYTLEQQNYEFIRELVIQVSVKIDYGNGTSTTNDKVYLAPNTTVLDALKAVADVKATYWTAYQSFLVDAINGVVNNANDNNRWWIYSVNGEHALVSADQYKLCDGDSIEWTYEQY